MGQRAGPAEAVVVKVLAGGGEGGQEVPLQCHPHARHISGKVLQGLKARALDTKTLSGWRIININMKGEKPNAGK